MISFYFSDDFVKAFYNPPFHLIYEESQTSEETTDVFIMIEGVDIGQVQSLISEYRKRNCYYDPLKILQIHPKVSSNNQENELLKLKLIRVKLNYNQILDDNIENFEQSDSQLCDQLLPVCDLSVDGESRNSLKSRERVKTGSLIESYNDSNREMFSVSFDGDSIHVSRSAIDEFRKISGLTEPLKAHREKVYAFLNEKETPVTILHLFPADASTKQLGCSIPSKETKPISKRGRPKGRGRRMVKVRVRKELNDADRYMNQFRTSKTRRKREDIIDIGSDSHLSPAEITDTEEDGISSFGCEMGIVVNGNSTAVNTDDCEGEGSKKEDFPRHELQSMPDNMNASLSPEDMWKFLLLYDSVGIQIHSHAAQFNNESWIEVKRMSDFYQVDGEVLTDLSFKVAYKDALTPVRYFLKGFDRLLKTGELNTANDVNHLFRCMSKDHKVCLGLKPSPYQPSIDSNDQLRRYFREKGQLISTPFDCLLSKSCRGIVKIDSSIPSSTFVRGSKNVVGVQALCRACTFLGKKINQIINSSPKNGVFSNDENHDKVSIFILHFLMLTSI